MQTNKKGGAEPQGSSSDLENDPGSTASGLAAEEINLVTSHELESREADKTSGNGAKKGMDNSSDSSSPNGSKESSTGSSSKPSQKKAADGKAGSLIQFLKEVLFEFRKISWPGGKEVMQATWSVLALVAIITLLVLGFDWVLAHAFFGPLEHWARLHGMGGAGLAR